MGLQLQQKKQNDTIISHCCSSVLHTAPWFNAI